MRTSISNDSLTVSVCHFGSGNWQMRKDLVTLDNLYQGEKIFNIKLDFQTNS